MAQELKDVIAKAIDALPAELRSALPLREFEGLSYEEIAEVIECPIGTVRSRIFRAREAIDQRVALQLQAILQLLVGYSPAINRLLVGRNALPGLLRRRLLQHLVNN